MDRTQLIVWAMALLPIVVLCVFYFYPLMRVLTISVTEPEFGLGNYRDIFTSSAVRRVVQTTLWICVVSSVVSLFFGYLLAYAIVHAAPSWQSWMLLAVLLSFWVSVLIRTFSWIALLQTRGLVNETLQVIGLIDEPIRFIRNPFGVILGMVHYMIPYAVLPLMANMRTIDTRYVPAARGLGASPFGAFWRVFLPLSLPGLISASILVFIFSIGFYITPALLGGGRSTMVAEYIALQVNETLAWGQGTALASSMLILVFAMLVVLGRIVKFRTMFGAA
ncbi:ABC transporter permease [Pseudoponticoccus marisrubri]|uniref:Polyamine ABC transporter permease n=1 Tax=Pseudoponticoccus marisrubri TaxID=1685382 RepID=A0A0W7WH88_9RHOB|nr:ABC transporter permease [Pseudoponticoccus marisrubri]KUF09925.1 polyamine ABC transporter permease [Pseudoponticoccus marisrubri]